MKLITTLIVLCTLTTFASADDWPNFRGANHNGNSSESTWNSRLGGAPKVAWRASVGEGYSSVAVAGGKVFTVGNSNGTDTVWGLDAATGRMGWRYSYRCDAGDYGGPRATPAVDGDRVYTFSRDGRAFCINANTGKLVWQANVAGIAKAEMPNWGFAGSPLVEGANVYYNAGDSGVALDKMTGKVFWRSGGGKGGYSTPVPFTQGGTRGIALFTSYGVAAVTASQGKVLWYFPWETNYGVNSADPLFYNILHTVTTCVKSKVWNLRVSNLSSSSL